jgi:hypothetical protein
MNSTQTIIYKALSDVIIRAEFNGQGLLNVITSTQVIDNAVQIVGLRVHEIELKENDLLFAWGDESVDYNLFIDGVEIPKQTYDKQTNNVLVEEAVDVYTNKTLYNYWYKSIGEVAAINLDVNSQWNGEAVAINLWYNQVYELLYTYKNSDEIMTPEQFIESLPVFNYG